MDGGGNGQNRTPKIEMSAMDGSGRTTIVSRNLRVPRAVTVDHRVGEEEGWIYWTDETRGRIESARLNGTNRTVVIGESES